MRKMIALIGSEHTPLLAPGLEALGLTVVAVPPNPFVAPPLRCHADLSVFPAGEGCAVIAPYLQESGFAETLRGHGVETLAGELEQGAVYPRDASLCACTVGKKLICRPDALDPVVLKLLSDYETVPVKQGYAKCSVCAVDERSIITADRGISLAAEKAGLSVLLISPGHIALTGYDSGFIGGASGLFDGRLVFTGTLDAHPDRAAILAFIAERGVEAVFLTKKPLFDIGSILAART